MAFASCSVIGDWAAVGATNEANKPLPNEAAKTVRFMGSPPCFKPADSLRPTWIGCQLRKSRSCE